MIEPTPVYLDPGFDHDAIERELDEQLGIEPKPRRERSWDCLAGEAPVVCQHSHISRSTSGGLTDVVCLSCGHEYLEAL